MEKRLVAMSASAEKDHFHPPARADVRRIDRDTAMRIPTALDRFARTGEGDIKKLEGNTGELRLRVGDYRVRFIENPPGTLYIHAVLHRSYR
jgi:mRNA interferase RelE/StbE